jgi:hypothetical protein
MQVTRFMNNWSISWGKSRYEIRVWRHFPWKIEFIDHHKFTQVIGPKYEDIVFPRCPEICKDCVDGRHIMHVVDELSDLWATEIDVITNGKKFKQIQINGWAEDRLWLEDLFRIVGLEHGRMQEKQKAQVHTSNR